MKKLIAIYILSVLALPVFAEDENKYGVYTFDYSEVSSLSAEESRDYFKELGVILSSYTSFIPEIKERDRTALAELSKDSATWESFEKKVQDYCTGKRPKDFDICEDIGELRVDIFMKKRAHR